MDNKEFDLNDPIDLGYIWELIWEKKKPLSISAIGFGIFSIIFSLSLTDIYESEVLLAPSGARNVKDDITLAVLI